jgi:hypothetical protein
VTAEEVFAAWAPDGVPWSSWAKPAPFAHVEHPAIEGKLQGFAAPVPPEWLAGITVARTALVIELPGVQSVAVGVSAAEVGFRPVPLFNALPGPRGDFSPYGGWIEPRPIAAVDVRSIIVALTALAPALRGGGPRGAGLARDAPPAFLVDSRRLDSRGALVPGRFDNRSAHGPADFPSAQRLREAGIEQVVVLLDASHPGWDLLPVLEGWRRAGLAIALKPLLGPVRPWPGFARAWLWRMGAWLRRLTLAGNGRRGFGAWVTASGG